MPLTQWLLLVLLAVMWSIGYTFVGLALRELPPITIVLARLSIAAAILIVVVQASGLAWPRGWAGWWPYAVMAMFNNVIPFILVARGQQEIASGLASVIVATTPLWVLVLTKLFRPGERIGATQIIGIALGVVGVAVLFGPEAFAGRGTMLLGMTLSLIGAMSYGCAGVWGARFRGVPPLLSSCCQLVCSSLIVLVLCIGFDRPWTLPMPGPVTIASLVAIAVVSTALAYLVFYRVLAVAGGANVMLVTLIMPPMSILFGIVLLGETFEPRYAIGAAIIALGLVVIDGRLPAALADRSSR